MADAFSVTTALAAALGFLGKSAWDLYWRRKEEARTLGTQKSIAFVEQQLSRFFWPVYLRLQKDNTIWEKLSDREHPTDEARRRVGERIESGVLLPNHDAIVRIIEENIHLALPDPELEPLLLQYLRHVAVYRTLRECGLEMDPIAAGEPWPKGLFPMVAERTQALQRRYSQLTCAGSNPKMPQRGKAGQRAHD
ncbi:MAG: hypothetical protein IT460_17570 [Planctomycetes bacterium]|nr:hypothetical protein [Planctomycetota bacterium]